MDIQWIAKLERAINLVEQAKDITEEIKEDSLTDALEQVITDLNNRYDEEASK